MQIKIDRTLFILGFLYFFQEQFMQKIMQFISDNSIGFIPLDMIAHFIGGMILVFICFRLKLNLLHTFLVVFGLSTLKEVNDVFIHH